MSDYISEDNLVLILKYLPVKTLLQFRSVCKLWKQLIDSPALVLDHLSVQTPIFIFQNGCARKLYLIDLFHRPRHSVKPLNKPIPRVDFYLFGTLHGVVCLFGFHKFLVWNPSIRKNLSIDLPKDVIWTPEFYVAFLVGKLQIPYGFWISPLTKEYKIMFLQTRPAVNCFLYSSIRGDWTVIPTPTKVEKWKSCKEGPPVMIGDVAHWGGCLDELFDQDHWSHDHQNKAILSFNFVHECFEIIELPDHRIYDNTAPFRWKDTLSLLCWNKEFPYRCEIFMRTEDSWVQMFNFRVLSDLVHVFWAMEDLEVGNKRGKGKRKREVQLFLEDFEGAQDSVRILATTVEDFKNSIGDLVLEGTRSGCKTVKKGLDNDSNVVMVYDFVESLLFP